MYFTKLLILFCLIHQICSGSYDIVFNKFEKMPETDPEFVDFGTLRISKKSRTEIKFSGKVYLFKKLTNVGMFTITGFRLNPMDIPIQVFYSSAGFCDQLAKDKYLYPNLVAHSDMPEDYCPYQPGNYTINDLIVHMDNFPEMIPLGEYMGTMAYSLNNHIKFGYKISASIVATDKNID